MEMIITIALILLFAGTGTVLITSAVRNYKETKGFAEALQVYDIILDKISGEIEGAIPTSPLNSGDAAAVKISEDSISLYDRTGSPVTITAEEITDLKSGNTINGLVIHYHQVNISERNYMHEIDWTYDDAMYMGYEIKSLRFSRDASHPANVIRIDLEMKKQGQTDGIHSAYRYVECYNFGEEEYGKITG